MEVEEALVVEDVEVFVVEEEDFVVEEEEDLVVEEVEVEDLVVDDDDEGHVLTSQLASVAVHFLVQ